MSVQKSFRFDDHTNAILELIAERTGKTQTAILSELIRGHVVFDMDKTEAMEIMELAEQRLQTLKSKESD